MQLFAGSRGQIVNGVRSLKDANKQRLVFFFNSQNATLFMPGYLTRSFLSGVSLRKAPKLREKLKPLGRKYKDTVKMMQLCNLHQSRYAVIFPFSFFEDGSKHLFLFILLGTLL